MFAMCNIVFVVHYYLFVMFNFFGENNHLFVFLKYLFPKSEITYLMFFFEKYHANIGKCSLILKILPLER